MTMISGIFIPQKPFGQRLRSMAVWWGVPAVLVELFWVPRDLWLYALILIIPATVVGVVTGAALLHIAATRRSQKSNDDNSRPK
jgi:membrane protein implicated in regulation of membrane protease activity